ncbi:hypothetical protein [Novosphingobium sp.]|uniref:hypothetical protein n=1 Tax=Novosphingobium sp. TaxID=1874826 RepID=UPI00286BC816|nr:hypothetical protein [Novosphingobium sp.]
MSWLMRCRLAFVLLIALAGCNERAAPRDEAGSAANGIAAAPETAAAPAPLPTMVVPVDLRAKVEAEAKLPADVAALTERIAACEHFAGEEPYDAERGKFLREQVAASCTGNAAALARLRKKYAGDAAAARHLAGLAAPDM